MLEFSGSRGVFELFCKNEMLPSKEGETRLEEFFFAFQRIEHEGGLEALCNSKMAKGWRRLTRSRIFVK